MNLNTTTVLWTILFCFGQAFVFGQVPFYKVNVKSKNNFIGQIVKEEGKVLTLKITDSSYVKVHENDIIKIRKLNPNKIKKGLLWDGSMHCHRYLFSSSAYTLAKGDFCYTNILGFYNGLEYGITDRLNISGGLNLYSVLTNENHTKIYNLALKYGNWKLLKRLTASISFNFSEVNYDPYQSFKDNDKHISLSGLFTYGNTDNHLTFGIGAYRFRGSHFRYDFNNATEIYDYKTNIFSTFRLNGILRISNYFALVTENWMVNSFEYSDFLSVGLRFQKYKFMAALAMVYKSDTGLGNYYEEYYPYVNVSYRF